MKLLRALCFSVIMSLLPLTGVEAAFVSLDVTPTGNEFEFAVEAYLHAEQDLIVAAVDVSFEVVGGGSFVFESTARSLFEGANFGPTSSLNSDGSIWSLGGSSLPIPGIEIPDSTVLAAGDIAPLGSAIASAGGTAWFQKSSTMSRSSRPTNPSPSRSPSITGIAVAETSRR